MLHDMTRNAVAMIVTLLAVAGAGRGPASAQPSQRPRPLENIRLLTGWDGNQVRAEMRLIAEALGVKCDHCHVQGNFPSDERRAKQTARRMIELTMTLNGEYFAGFEPAAGASRFGRVTCYTCHQGAAVPKTSAWMGHLE
jgi:photosynthetic reaction center cytochrome c subunit